MTKPRLMMLLVVFAIVLGIVLVVRWCAELGSDAPPPDRDPGPSDVTEADGSSDPAPPRIPATPEPTDFSPSPEPPKPAPEPVILVIIDAGDRAPVVGARAWRTVDRALTSTVVVSTVGEGEFQHGVPDTRGLRAGHWSDDRDGRIVLDPGADYLSILVWAPGYAWRQLEVARARGGEIEVPLARGGELRLRIPRIGELRDPLIDSRIDGIEVRGDLRLPPPRRSDEILLSGLLTGRHRIEVRDGPEGRVVGAGTVEINAGYTAELTIDLTPDPVALGEVAGSFTVPEQWVNLPLRVVLTDTDGKSRGESDLPWDDDDSDTDIRKFGPLQVLPGRYVLEVQPIQWRMWITVPPSGTTLDVVLPEPAEAWVRVIDEATGDEPSDPGVSWHIRLEGLMGYYLEEADYSPELGAFLILAPPGALIVEAEAEGCLEGRLVLETEAGKSYRRTIALRRAAVLEVRFTLDGKPFPADGIRVAVTYLSGEQEGAMNVMSSEGDAVTFTDLEAGMIRVEVMLPAGFMKIEPRELEVRTGERKELSIELARE